MYVCYFLKGVSEKRFLMTASAFNLQFIKKLHGFVRLVDLSFLCRIRIFFCEIRNSKLADR